MGELQHGTHDDCEDLTKEEVNVFYNFYENGEIHSDDDKNPDQSNNKEDSVESVHDQLDNEEDSNESVHEGHSEDHTWAMSSMDVNKSEEMDPDRWHNFSAAVCYS